MSKTLYITNPFTKQKYAIDIHNCKPVTPVEVIKKTVTTKNTYEAAYYMTAGALFESAGYRKLRKKKAYKKGYMEQWYITLKDVPETMIEAYNIGKCRVNVRLLESARLSLKRKIKKHITENKTLLNNAKEVLL